MNTPAGNKLEGSESANETPTNLEGASEGKKKVTRDAVRKGSRMCFLNNRHKDYI
jgi:hypothetical protein